MELLQDDPPGAITCVDIPIGLPNRDARACDLEARRLLGPRKSSVFAAPIRPCVESDSDDRGRVSELAFKTHGRKVGAHAWGMYPKVRDFDAAFRAWGSDQSRVREVHPELSFRCWNSNTPMEASKKTLAGLTARLSLVQQAFGDNAFDIVRARHRRGKVADDDILDAFAALWTARRIADGIAHRVPEQIDRDARGLVMEMWC